MKQHYWLYLQLLFHPYFLLFGFMWTKGENKMSIELKEIEVKNAHKRFDIFVDGIEVGWTFKKTEQIGWHAVIKIPASLDSHNLAQGFGDCPQSSIDDAFSRTENEIIEFSEALQSMKKRLLHD